MTRVLGSVDASQIWADAFFTCMDKLRTYDVGHANSAADFADAAVARFNRSMDTDRQMPLSDQVDETANTADTPENRGRSGGILGGLVNGEMAGRRGIRIGDMEGGTAAPSPGTLDFGEPS